MATVGVMVLVGWYANIPILRSILPGLVTMKANTAACFLAAGIALVLASRAEPLSPMLQNVGLGLSGLAVLVGGLSLAQYAIGWDFHIDQLLVRESLGAVETSHPGRMAPPTALDFVLLGTALGLMCLRRAQGLITWLALGGSLFGAMGLVSYLLNLPFLATFGPFTAMAPPTGLTFILLAGGILLAQHPVRLNPRLLGVGLLVSLSFLVVAGVGVGRSLRLLDRTHHELMETVTTLENLERLDRDVQALESSVRGFVATGDSRFDHEQEVLKEAVFQDLQTLSDRWGGTTVQGQSPLSALEEAIERKLAFSGELLNLRRQGRASEATAALATGHGAELMALVRSGIRTAREAQNGNLQRRKEHSEADGLRTFVASTLSLILALCILGVVFVILRQEVLERRAAERRLQDSNSTLEARVAERTRALDFQRAELQTILDSIRTWVFYKDRDNHFVRVNRAFAEIMGKPKSELEGASLWDLFPREQAEAFWKDDLEVIEAGQPKTGIIEPMASAHGLRWVLTDKTPYRDAEGTIIGVIGTTLDITEMKGAEDLLRQQQVALEEANRKLHQKVVELDEFNFVASHDLQEPLRKLVSFSELLPGDLPGELPERAAMDLRYIMDAGKRMQRLIQDLLTLSRTGRNEMRLTVVSLEQCLDEALSNLGLSLEEAGAEVIRLPLPTIRGDQGMLTRLFQNLVGNAIKFHHLDRPPRVQISAVPEGDGWVLQVADNGIGIEPRHHEQIFAPFKRLHGRGTYEGTGIGLSICRKIAERHDGRIWVESVPGEGSRFCVALPLNAGPATVLPGEEP